MLRRFAKVVSDVDDKVQRGMRSGINMLPGDDQVKETYSQFMHPLRDSRVHPKGGKYDKHIAIGGSRAAQAGLITAAGLGLMRLTEQFGTVADQQERGQLRISDLPEVHQELIKGRPGEVIAAGMQGVGVMAGIPQKDLEMMQTAVANEEFYR